jgi:hypothetical protein
MRKRTRGSPDSEEIQLFNMPNAVMPKTLSADAKRTWRRKNMLERGIHPATRLPLANNGETCGTCVHSRKNWRFWKCELVELTFGPGTDIRVSWPACQRWEGEGD